MKILAVEWRSAIDTVGIVLIENGIGKQSARIGTTQKMCLYGGKLVSIGTVASDAEYIAKEGAKLSFREAQAFFPWIKEEDYKK